MQRVQCVAPLVASDASVGEIAAVTRGVQQRMLQGYQGGVFAAVGEELRTFAPASGEERRTEIWAASCGLCLWDGRKKVMDHREQLSCGVGSW